MYVGGSTCATIGMCRSDDPLLPTMWVPKIKPGLLGVAASASAHWANFPDPKDLKNWFELKIS